MAITRPKDARERLLTAAIDVFGRLGFAGATTRAIAQDAGLNLQAIAYHFGNKEGLYLGAADHIGERLRAQTGPMADAARARFASGRAIAVDEARAMLTAMLGSIAGILFDARWAPVARFMVREQMDPTSAFDRVYERVLAPQLELGRHIVAILLDAPPDSERVKLRTMSLLGSVIFFRIAHATVARQLAWTATGPRELAAIRELIAEIVVSVGRSPKRSS